MPEVVLVLLPEGITGSGTRNHAGSCTEELPEVKTEIRTGSCTGSQNRQLYWKSEPEVLPEVRTGSFTGSQNRNRLE